MNHERGQTSRTESVFTQPVRGITVREISNAVIEAHHQLHPEIETPEFLVFQLINKAREFAARNAGDDWTISRKKGPFRGHALEYDRLHVERIIDEFEKITENASSHRESWRSRHSTLRLLGNAKVTPEVGQKAKELLFQTPFTAS